jgi:hypothetical protein
MRLLAAMVAAFVCSPAIAADYLGKVLAVSDGDTFTMEADGAKIRFDRRTLSNSLPQPGSHASRL